MKDGLVSYWVDALAKTGFREFYLELFIRKLTFNRILLIC